MTELAPRELERRLLILAPVGKDAALIEGMLRRDVSCTACSDLESLAGELERGAAAILVTEEAFAERIGRLAGIIAHQPPWSDLPVLLLTRHGADSHTVDRALEMLGNVTLLERPVRVGALLSAVRSAVRARERQYQTRAHMDEREENDRRKDEFLATLAHELRNPLAPIRNSLRLLRMENEKQSITPVCAILERQVEHMVRLVDDLMEVSRITRGKIELRREIVNLDSVIAAAVETSRPLIDAAHHQLTVTCAAEQLCLDADAVRLSQVFSNLLNNAAKYTDPGGRISIATRREDGEAVVTVSDNGVGIPAHALSAVFDMFSQADAARGQSGLGIGLTLARSLLAMHGGTVSAASDGVGKGSEFVVRLPLAAGEMHDQCAGNTVTPATEGTRRVLVVDDNRDAADTLGALVGILGADVRVVYDGASALDALESFRPDLVVLDLGMPDMDGYEVARRIRERYNGSSPRIVALTGWGQEKDRRRTEAAGFNHHLVKPVDLDAMQAVLDSVGS